MKSIDMLAVGLVMATSCLAELPDGHIAKDALHTVEEKIPFNNSAQSVMADLQTRNETKPAVFPVDNLHSNLLSYYAFKETLADKTGIQFGIDYAILVQHASYTQSGENTALSQVFRILGTWAPLFMPEDHQGLLVWKMETRGSIGGHPAPRDMGFDTGSSLSTANFKELNYWGITDLYWKQRFSGGDYTLIAGHTDPGDWADQYPLLNALTAFMNDAFYNNPTEAIPKRGFGLVGQAYLAKHLYLMGGVHDANGKDGRLDFQDFVNTGEIFSWAEFGHRGDRSVSSRVNSHIHFWHQDERVEAATDESWGAAYTHSYVSPKDRTVFLRAGYSEGDAAQMRRFI